LDREWGKAGLNSLLGIGQLNFIINHSSLATLGPIGSNFKKGI